MQDLLFLRLAVGIGDVAVTREEAADTGNHAVGLKALLDIGDLERRLIRGIAKLDHVEPHSGNLVDQAEIVLGEGRDPDLRVGSELHDCSLSRD